MDLVGIPEWLRYAVSVLLSRHVANIVELSRVNHACCYIVLLILVRAPTYSPSLYDS